MNVEKWWNDTAKGKLKKLKRNLSQCHFFRHKSKRDCPGIELVLPRCHLLYENQYIYIYIYILIDLPIDDFVRSKDVLILILRQWKVFVIGLCQYTGFLEMKFSYVRRLESMHILSCKYIYACDK